MMDDITVHLTYRQLQYTADALARRCIATGEHCLYNPYSVTRNDYREYRSAYVAIQRPLQQHLAMHQLGYSEGSLSPDVVRKAEHVDLQVTQLTAKRVPTDPNDRVKNRRRGTGANTRKFRKSISGDDVNGQRDEDLKRID